MARFPEFCGGGADDDDVRRGGLLRLFGREVGLVTLQERPDEQEGPNKVDPLRTFELGERHLPDRNGGGGEYPMVHDEAAQRWPAVGFFGRNGRAEQVVEGLSNGVFIGHVQRDRTAGVADLIEGDSGVRV